MSPKTVNNICFQIFVIDSTLPSNYYIAIMYSICSMSFKNAYKHS